MGGEKLVGRGCILARITKARHNGELKWDIKVTLSDWGHQLEGRVLYDGLLSIQS